MRQSSNKKSLYRYTVEEINEIMNRNAVIYQTSHHPFIQDDAIREMLDVSRELVRVNCVQIKHTIDTFNLLALEEIREIYEGEAFVEALTRYDSTKGNFMRHWRNLAEFKLLNIIRHEKSDIARANHHSLRGDECYTTDGEGDTLFSCLADTSYSIEDMMLERQIDSIVDDFAHHHHYGQLIAIDWQFGRQKSSNREDSDKVKAICHVLGSDLYGARERKIMQRTRQDFKTFLHKNYGIMSQTA